MAGRMVLISKRSPTTISAPRSARASERSSTRCTMARTLSPRVRDSRTAACPVLPVAPVMRTVLLASEADMSVLPLVESACGDGLDIEMDEDGAVSGGVVGIAGNDPAATGKSESVVILVIGAVVRGGLVAQDLGVVVVPAQQVIVGAEVERLHD